MQEKVVFIFFLILAAFEMINKHLYRKEIPCPYCGFDATWYRRDVKVARQKVENFFSNDQNSSEQIPVSAPSVEEVSSDLAQ